MPATANPFDGGQRVFPKGAYALHLCTHRSRERREKQMRPTRRLWQWLAAVFELSFAALGWIGREIYLAAPPIPDCNTTTGVTLYRASQVQDGQRAWLAAGGQQLGTVWGHGSYVAPDWSADWLHREGVAYRDIRSQATYGVTYDKLTLAQRGSI